MKSAISDVFLAGHEVVRDRQLVRVVQGEIGERVRKLRIPAIVISKIGAS